MRKRWWWIPVGLVLVVGLVYGGILVWTKVINPPEDALDEADLAARVQVSDPPPTTVTNPDVDAVSPEDDPASTQGPETDSETPASPDSRTDPASSATDSVEGRWVIISESELGYRVPEILGGIDTEGVGRTSQVEGFLDIEGTAVTQAEFVVDVASIRSDSSQRDGQFRGRIMDTATYPNASFALTSPIDLGTIPADGVQITAEATGELTLRGVTRSVTFEVTAQRGPDRLGVLGRIPVVFADYEIPNPSNSFVSTGDEGEIEFVLVLIPD